MFKKLLVSLFIIATLLSPFSVSAMTEQELKDNLISMLTQVIAMLQQQIKDILATQVLTTPIVVKQAQDIQTQLPTVTNEPLTPIQKDTVNIVQQTTNVINPPLAICSPNWQCSNWNTCSASSQTRTCDDLNNCGILTGKPIESQSCIEPLVFTETPKLVWRNGGMAYITYQTNFPSKIISGPIYQDNSSDGWSGNSNDVKQSCGYYGSTRTIDHTCKIVAKDESGKTVEYQLNIIIDSIDLPTN